MRRTYSLHFHVFKVRLHSFGSLKSIDFINTKGVGDAFFGGFASRMVHLDGDRKEVVQYATVVAGLSVTKLRTAPAMPNTSEIMTMLDSNPFSLASLQHMQVSHRDPAEHRTDDT